MLTTVIRGLSLVTIFVVLQASRPAQSEAEKLECDMMSCNWSGCADEVYCPDNLHCKPTLEHCLGCTYSPLCSDQGDCGDGEREVLCCPDGATLLGFC